MNEDNIQRFSWSRGAIDPRGLFSAGIILILSFTSAFGSAKGDPENRNVASIARAVRLYADQNHGRLPEGLHLLERSSLTVPAWRSLDTYIYFPYDLPISDLPSGAPIVVFPAEGGAYVGFLDGAARFAPGGTSERNPTEARRVAANWRIAFLGSLLLFSVVLSVVIQILTKRSARMIHAIILVVFISIVGAILLP